MLVELVGYCNRCARPTPRAVMYRQGEIPAEHLEGIRSECVGCGDMIPLTARRDEDV